MDKPVNILLFNSGLPEACENKLELSRMLGPWGANFRGRNIGNGYISHATLNSIYGTNLKVDHIANAWTCDFSDELLNKINEKYTHLVFIMQDFLSVGFSSQPFYSLCYFLSRLKIPVVPISLGANGFDNNINSLVEALSEDQKEFAKILSDKSIEIGVRGEFSAQVLKKIGIENVVVTGCPSLFEKKKNRKLKKIEFKYNKVITNGGFIHADLLDSYHLLQDELFFINSLFWDYSGHGHALDDSSVSMTFDLNNLQEYMFNYQRAFSNRIKFFTDYNEWRGFYNKYKPCLTIGTRLHSAIQSLNSGVPAIVTNSDMRSKEVCDLMGIDHYPNFSSNRNLNEVYDSINIEYQENKYKEQLNIYNNYLANHGLVEYTADKDLPVFEYEKTQEIDSKKSSQRLLNGYLELIDNIKGYYSSNIELERKIETANSYIRTFKDVSAIIKEV